jgi:hypothetical protein
MAKRSGKNVFHPNSQANNFATMKKAKTITTIDSGDRRKNRGNMLANPIGLATHTHTQEAHS